MSRHTLRNCPFAFRCTKQWLELKQTDSDKLRFCDDCQQPVYLCETDEELTEAIIQNRCVAIRVFPARHGFGSPTDEDWDIGFPF